MPGDDDEELGDEEDTEAKEETPEAPEQFFRIKLPDIKKGEVFGVADQLLGGSRLKVMCQDGKSRLSRIPGKMRRRMWIREGDLLIVKPWDFQDDKADVVFRYTKIQAHHMSRRGLVPKEIDIY